MKISQLDDKLGIQNSKTSYTTMIINTANAPADAPTTYKISLDCLSNSILDKFKIITHDSTTNKLQTNTMGVDGQGEFDASLTKTDVITLTDVVTGISYDGTNKKFIQNKYATATTNTSSDVVTTATLLNDMDLNITQITNTRGKTLATIDEASGKVSATFQDIEITPFQVKGLAAIFDTKANIANPEFTGSISLGRKSGTTAGSGSSAIGYDVEASGYQSHAEGTNSVASGSSSHAEGGTDLFDPTSHTTASGRCSHAEGAATTASGFVSHSEGVYTVASGGASHAEGDSTTASGENAHSEGWNTVANHQSQHVSGEYNVPDPSTAESTARGNYAEIIGNGTGPSEKSNARALDWSGNEYLKGDVYVNCNADSSGGSKVATETQVNAKLNTSLKGVANGVAELDANGHVPSSQLPSYVDDVLEYANLSSFPVTGESGKIYVALDTNLTYRWGGSVYVTIASDLALGETSNTAYRGDRGKTAYDHATDANKSTAAFPTGFYKIASTAEGHIRGLIAVTKQDITDLGIPGDISGKADKSNTVFDTTLSRGRKENTTIGMGSFAFGDDVEASGIYSQATGSDSIAAGYNSCAQGISSIAHGDNSHAEGILSKTYADNSHAEGYNAITYGENSHAEGKNTIARGLNEHVSGKYNYAAEATDWAAGTHYYEGDLVLYSETLTSGATRKYIKRCITENTDSTWTEQHWEDGVKFLDVVGNGTSSSNRSNARALDLDGNEYLKGDLYVNCNNDSTGGTKVATETQVYNLIENVLANFGLSIALPSGCTFTEDNYNGIITATITEYTTDTTLVIQKQNGNNWDTYTEGDAWNIGDVFRLVGTRSATIGGNTHTNTGTIGTYTTTGEYIISHNLTINYTDGTNSVAETYTGTVAQGAVYSIASPSVTNMAPDIATVTGTMGENDVTVTVTYSKIPRTVTVVHEYADHSTAAASTTINGYQGDSYTTNALTNISGYGATVDNYSGTMGDSNITVTFTYTPLHTFTIQYRGNESSTSDIVGTYTEQIAEGKEYYINAMAHVDQDWYTNSNYGYNKAWAGVSPEYFSGTMGNSNLTVDTYGQWHGMGHIDM